MERDQIAIGAARGCACESFKEAVRLLFIEDRGGRFHLGDRASDGRSGRGAGISSGWAVTYGPEISHCPFCGAGLSVS